MRIEVSLKYSKMAFKITYLKSTAKAHPHLNNVVKSYDIIFISYSKIN